MDSKYTKEEFETISKAVELLKREEATIIHSKERIAISVNGNRGKIIHHYTVALSEKDIEQIEVSIGENNDCNVQENKIGIMEFKPESEDYQDIEDW